MAKFFTSLILSVILVLSTLFIPSMVSDYSYMKNVKFGYPVHFLVQDQSALTPPSYPRYQTLNSPLEHPLNFLFHNFVFSVVIVWAIILSMVYLFNLLNKYRRI